MTTLCFARKILQIPNKEEFHAHIPKFITSKRHTKQCCHLKFNTNLVTRHTLSLFVSHYHKLYCLFSSALPCELWLGTRQLHLHAYKKCKVKLRLFFFFFWLFSKAMWNIQYKAKRTMLQLLLSYSCYRKEVLLWS